MLPVPVDLDHAEIVDDSELLGAGQQLLAAVRLQLWSNRDRKRRSYLSYLYPLADSGSAGRGSWLATDGGLIL